MGHTDSTYGQTYVQTAVILYAPPLKMEGAKTKYICDIAPDKRSIKKIYCGYSLEAAEMVLMSTYNICFLWRNKKNFSIFGLKKSFLS